MEDAATPTAVMDSVMIVSAITAQDKRDIATLDLPGAFLYTLMDEKVKMFLEGELCELMYKVDLRIYH